MKRLDARQGLATSAGAVTIALTGAAFWLSYEHLHDVAEANGLDGARAWAWPGTVDAFIIAGELLILRAALRGRFDWFAYLLAGAGSLGSIALNVAGVGAGAEPLEYIVAAVPPVAALLAFAAVMRQVHERLAARDETPEPAPEATTTLTVERVADDQPHALPVAPEVVPAGVEMLPIVALPEPKKTFVFDHSRQQYMPSDSTNGYVDWPSPEEPKPPVLGPFFTLPQAPATPVALLSVADVAQARGVAEGTVRSWVARDKLTPAQRDPDGRLLFHPDAVAALN